MSKKDLIKPRTLKGFRDYLPDAMIAREQLIDTAKRVYRSYGFTPIDTPALEYSEILLGKGGDESDKQLFRFMQGKRDVAMRFDLTVPLARFAAQHAQELGLPFKPYHIGTVWRGENPQHGRYREFMQCDFDIIGTEANSADIECLLVIHDLFEAIGFSRFTIRINNRLVLNGLLEMLGLTEATSGVLRCIDKLTKVGRDKVVGEMIERVGLTAEQANQVLDLTGLSGTNQEIITVLEEKLQGSEQGLAGVCRLKETLSVADRSGIDVSRIELDVSIARGLDYYTGTIYETFLTDKPEIGSVCSGGRYDNLAELFTKQQLPGVGASLGLDRLLTAMEELGMVDTSPTPARVLVTQFEQDRLGDYQRVARVLRAEGIPTEVFPEPRAIGKQLKYANRKRFEVAVIAGGDEFEAGVWQVKDLQAGDQSEIVETDLVDHVRSLLS